VEWWRVIAGHCVRYAAPWKGEDGGDNKNSNFLFTGGLANS
jgi:hypothetical protein